MGGGGVALVAMANRSSLQKPEEEFIDLLKTLDYGIAQGAVILRGEGRAFRQLVVIDNEAAGFDEAAWAADRPVVLDLAPMIFFAFENASDSIVRDWFRDVADADQLPDEADLETAVRRVNLIREYMPTALAVWKARSAALLPSLGQLRYRIGPEAENGSRIAQLQIVASRGAGQFSDDRTETVTLELLAADVAYFARVLGKIKEELGS